MSNWKMATSPFPLQKSSRCTEISYKPLLSFLPLPEDRSLRLSLLFLCIYRISHFAQFFNPICARFSKYSVNRLLREFVHQLPQRNPEKSRQRHHVSRADGALPAGQNVPDGPRIYTRLPGELARPHRALAHPAAKLHRRFLILPHRLLLLLQKLLHNAVIDDLRLLLERPLQNSSLRLARRGQLQLHKAPHVVS